MEICKNIDYPASCSPFLFMTTKLHTMMKISINIFSYQDVKVYSWTAAPFFWSSTTRNAVSESILNKLWSFVALKLHYL